MSLYLALLHVLLLSFGAATQCLGGVPGPGPFVYEPDPGGSLNLSAYGRAAYVVPGFCGSGDGYNGPLGNASVDSGGPCSCGEDQPCDYGDTHATASFEDDSLTDIRGRLRASGSTTLEWCGADGGGGGYGASQPVIAFSLTKTIAARYRASIDIETAARATSGWGIWLGTPSGQQIRSWGGSVAESGERSGPSAIDEVVTLNAGQVYVLSMSAGVQARVGCSPWSISPGSGTIELAYSLEDACGDGTMQGPEECDDGDLVDGDGCDHNCKPTGCGNGVVTAPEECDDGNLDADDGCATDCTVEPPAGKITELAGTATILHADGSRDVANVGAPVVPGDVIETGADGAVGLLFADNTTFTVTENARLSIDEYRYNNGERADVTFVSLLQGLFVYTSGLIGKKDPGAVDIETPVGGIGPRGTEFLTMFDAAAQVLTIHLIHGSIDLTPHSTGATSGFTGPITIVLSGATITASPLILETYRQLKADALRLLSPGPCGDGHVGPGEQCDDGNTDSGDCCSELCAYEAPGLACADDGDACTDDACDGAGLCTHEPQPSCATSTTSTTSSTTTTTLPGTCAPAPLAGCRLPVEPGESTLQMKDMPVDSGDALSWKWLKGAATNVEDWGAPAATTSHVACVYDGASNLLFGLRAPAGGTCGTRPCWRASEKGYAYTDKERSPDGVMKLTLSAGAAAKAKVILTAKGDNLPLPRLGRFTLPLRVQLQGGGRCWEASYGAPRLNTETQFKASAD